MSPGLFCGVLLATLMVGSPSAASPMASQGARDGDPVLIGTYRELHSDVLDEDRLLLVSLPTGYEGSSASYPVLFVLYGDDVRGYFAEAVHTVDRLSEEGSILQMVVVGVANVDRYRDLSPIDRPGQPSRIERFLRFFAEELMPYVETQYRTKDLRLLVGPQAGAEFGLYALSRSPGLFDAMILSNPFRSTAVHEFLLTALGEQLSEGFVTPTFIQITCTDTEGLVARTAEVEYARDFQKTVGRMSPHNLSLVVHYLEHNQDFIPSLRLGEGLRELFRGYRFPDDRNVRGFTDIADYYAALSERLGFDLDIPERALVLKADELSQSGAGDAAMEVLENLLRLYPASADGHWRLANLCRERGDSSAALEHYRRCLEIIPNMRPAREWIDRLETEERR